MQVFLIRHPPPDIAGGICYGRLDVSAQAPLAAAERLRPLLPENIPVFSSPLRRAHALAAALHAAPIVDRRLSEIDFGEWEGRRWDDIERPLLDAWAADVLNFVPPGGESAAMLQARVIQCFEERVAPLPVAHVALVTHSGVMRALLGHWLRLPAGEWSTLKFAFGRVTLVEIEAGQVTLRYLNR